MTTLPNPASVSVVMPAYRLGDCIAANILTVARVVPDAEIVIVDDGSDDRTFEQAEQAAASVPRGRVIRHEKNRGKGAALQTGAMAASGSVVVFLDGDLDLPPEQLPGLLRVFADTNTDVLVGAKQMDMGEGKYPWKRRALSKIFSTITGLFFRLPVEETQTGLKILRRTVLDAVLADLQVAGYAFDLELLLRAHRAGFRIIQVPVELRLGASSAPLSLATLWEMGRDTLRILVWSRRTAA